MTSDEEGRGFLYPNKKRENDKAPHTTGECVILGHRVRLAGWTQTARDGTKYVSIKLEDKGVAPDKLPEDADQA